MVHAGGTRDRTVLTSERRRYAQSDLLSTAYCTVKVPLPPIGAWPAVSIYDIRLADELWKALERRTV